MFERFTEPARRAVVIAQEESRLLGHDHIGTEHILLGLLRAGEGVATGALQTAGIELEPTRDRVAEAIGGGGQSPSGHIPFTPRLKRVFELSLLEAQELRHKHIGSEHILLGLLREGEGVAARVLIQSGAELSGIRRTVINRLSGTQQGEEQQTQPLSGPGSRSRQSINIEGLKHRSPIPAATLIGPLLISSVIVGVDPDTQELPASTEGQISHVFTHIGSILDQAGASWSDVAEVTFAMVDLDDRGLIGPLWLEHFPVEASRPAREVQQRSELAGGALITARFTAYVIS